MGSSFTVITRAKVPRERLFDLSLDIDAHLASMSESDERAIDGVTAGTIGLGEEVTWRARHFGVWFTMTSRITALDRPHCFVDEQTRGPFRSFRHEHLFESVGDDTVMTDTITLASPVFGILAERMVLVPYLRRLIIARGRHLVSALEA
jgi:ligand-binding SRPBCC domain-containing protein